MGIVACCPMDADTCRLPVKVHGNTFFLAESAAPAAAADRRRQAIHEAVGQRYHRSSAADEGLPPGFSCELCHLVQSSAWCLADISGDDSVVMLAAGMMLALGRPVVILAPPEMPLALPDEMRGLRVIPFSEYIDVIQPLREALDQIAVEATPTPREELPIPEIPLEDSETLENTPDDPVKLYNRAIALAEQGEYDAAVMDYSRALELRPDDPVTLCNRGNAYTNLEDYAAALADLDRALELKPGYAAALGNRGIVYTFMGHQEPALADYLAALKARPDDANIRYNTACVLALLERTCECLRELETAIMLDPENRDLARGDTDFDFVRRDRRFKVMLGEAPDIAPEVESESEAELEPEETVEPEPEPVPEDPEQEPEAAPGLASRAADAAAPSPEDIRAARKTHATNQVRMVLGDEW